MQIKQSLGYEITPTHSDRCFYTHSWIETWLGSWFVLGLTIQFKENHGIDERCEGNKYESLGHYPPNKHLSTHSDYVGWCGRWFRLDVIKTSQELYEIVDYASNCSALISKKHRKYSQL